MQNNINTDEGDAEFLSAFSESVNNGKCISWRYWVEQMPFWTAAQAARLMCALDPDVFESLESRPNSNDPSDLILKTKQIQRLAEAQDIVSLRPAQWIVWADKHTIGIHAGLRIEVNAMPNVELAHPPTESSPKVKNNWGELEVNKLIRESNEPNMTHKKLAEQYDVSRQFISRKLKEVTPLKANAFTSFVNHRKK
jgi:hypothetical protein